VPVRIGAASLIIASLADLCAALKRGRLRTPDVQRGFAWIGVIEARMGRKPRHEPTAEMQADLPPDASPALHRYADLLLRWNQSVNLIGRGEVRSTV